MGKQQKTLATTPVVSADQNHSSGETSNNKIRLSGGRIDQVKGLEPPLLLGEVNRGDLGIGEAPAPEH